MICNIAERNRRGKNNLMNFKILVYVFVYVWISMWSNKRMLKWFCLFMVAYNCRLYIQNTNTIQRVRRVLYLLLTTVTATTSRKQIIYSKSNTQPTINRTIFIFTKRLAKCQMPTHQYLHIFSRKRIIILWFTYTKIVYFFYFFLYFWCNLILMSFLYIT